MSKRVLIVDSDKQFMPILKDVFARIGFEVATTDEREEAIELARQKEPDLILLSAELPAGNAEGYLVCKDLKQNGDLKEIPVILTSRKAKEQDFAKHRKLKTRADDYLRKPFTDEELFQRIENLLGFQISNDEYLALEEKLHGFLEEKTKLDEELEDRNAQILELEKKVEKLESDLEKSDASGKLEERDARIRELEAEIESQQMELESRDKQKAKLEEALDETRDEFAEKLKEARQEVDAAERALESEREQGETVLAEKKERITELEAECEELNSARDQLAGELKSLEEERDGLQEREFELEKALESAREETKAVGDLESERDELTTRVSELEERLDAAEKAATEAQKVYARVRKAMEKVLSVLPEDE